jgi:hypothetical protein
MTLWKVAVIQQPMKFEDNRHFGPKRFLNIHLSIADDRGNARQESEKTKA